eukprot:scaffold194165_cov15-Tisochrysis_lutea.AAC.1
MRWRAKGPPAEADGSISKERMARRAAASTSGSCMSMRKGRRAAKVEAAASISAPVRGTWMDSR